MKNIIKSLTLSLFLVSHFSFGQLIVTGDCHVENATLTTVQLSDLDIENNTGGATGVNLLQNGPYNASECIGIYAGNDSQLESHLTPHLNIGQSGDGLLNGGGPLTGDEFIDGLVDGVASPWFDGDKIDIDNDGNATDPGWINLAKFDVDDNSTTYKSITNYDETISLLISDVLEFTFECVNVGGDCSSINWTLTTDKDIAETVGQVLNRSTFDHLAFVTKAGSGNQNGQGNQDDKGWAVYDFNFYEIFGSETPGAFNFETAYSLGGSIDVKPGDFSAGLSHLTVWARDPIGDSTTTVPEPSTIALFGLSLMLIAIRRKRL